jgi:pimeloyl-ACP methyl ester carboxylesterase
VQLTPRLEGGIALYAEPRAYEGDRPVVVLLHGARRNARPLFEWAPLLADIADVVLVDLPGHGVSPGVLPATLTHLGETVAQALHRVVGDRRIVLLGESVGGLVSMAIAGMRTLDVTAVVAADPPLTTTKLARVFHNWCRVINNEPQDDFLRSFALEVFGVEPGVGHRERIYYPLIAESPVVIDLVTGDEPARPFESERGCLLDEVDRFVIEALYKHRARVHLAPGAGHFVLQEGRSFCLDLVRRRIREAADSRDRER